MIRIVWITISTLIRIVINKNNCRKINLLVQVSLISLIRPLLISKLCPNMILNKLLKGNINRSKINIKLLKLLGKLYLLYYCFLSHCFIC